LEGFGLELNGVPRIELAPAPGFGLAIDRDRIRLQVITGMAAILDCAPSFKQLAKGDETPAD
jgi:hypothetical protein